MPKIGNKRWTVVVLLFFATTINYLDRQVIGFLKPTLELEFNWSESDYALIITTFSAAYAIGLLFFGHIIDRIGTKIGYTVSVVFWSLAAMAHSLASGTLSFGFMRALLGLGEAGNFPAAIKSVAEWFPKKERALATGLFNSGASIGAVITPLLVPIILFHFGWRMTFLLTGAIGFVWLVFWLIYYEIPAKKKSLSTQELAYIRDEVEVVIENEAPVKWIKLLTIPQTWAFIAGKFLTDPIWWFFLFWLPSYFSSTFELDLTKPSLHLGMIYLSTTLGSIGGGYLSSFLIGRGWTVLKARKLSMLFFAVLVVPVMAAGYTTSIWSAVALISLAAAAHNAWSANIFTIVSDVFPKRAISSVVGIGGMAGAVGGLIFPLIVGYLLDLYKQRGDITEGYSILFVICGSAYLVAWLFIHLLTSKMKPVSNI
jgi:ACS family hexuronate transporter-like MFS transporter